MALLIVDEGLVNLLKIALGNVASGDLHLHLYTNAHAPAPADTVADYTEPGGGIGYAVVTIPETDWATNLALHVATAIQAPFTFTFTGGPVTIEGYYVTDNTDAVLLWAEQALAPIAIGGGGGSLDVSVKIQFKNC